MLGLPTEEDEDIKGIAYLAEKIAEHYYEIQRISETERCQITVSTPSSFQSPSRRSSGLP